jgi:hypothetical protein
MIPLLLPWQLLFPLCEVSFAFALSFGRVSPTFVSFGVISFGVLVLLICRDWRWL